MRRSMKVFGVSCSDTSDGIDKLRRYSLQTCEICDKKFMNRYDMNIHNLTHIIIPLLRSIPCTCVKCGLYCISEEHLQHHISVRHKELMIQKNNNNDMKSQDHTTKLEAIDTKDGIKTEEYLSDGHEALDNLIKKEHWENATDSILSNFVVNCKVDIEKFNPRLLEENIKSDICKMVSVAKFKSSDFSASDDPVRLASQRDIVDPSNAYYHSSIHFEDLKRPGIFHCKHCLQRFPNRYEVIIHEVVHMDLSKVISKKIRRKNHKDNDQNNHNQLSFGHSTRHCSKNMEVRIFSDVQTQDNMDLHAQSKFYCLACKNVFSCKKSMKSHKKKCNRDFSQHVNLCSNCYRYWRITKGDEHTVINFGKYGVKKRCHQCKRYFNEVWSLKGKDSKDVPKAKSSRIVDRIQFEDGTQETQRSRKQHLTNHDRLKIIQKRFKLINKYNSF